MLGIAEIRCILCLPKLPLNAGNEWGFLPKLLEDEIAVGVLL
jgi:hypothetical protein